MHYKNRKPRFIRYMNAVAYIHTHGDIHLCYSEPLWSAYCRWYAGFINCKKTHWVCMVYNPFISMLCEQYSWVCLLFSRSLSFSLPLSLNTHSSIFRDTYYIFPLYQVFFLVQQLIFVCFLFVTVLADDGDGHSTAKLPAFFFPSTKSTIKKKTNERETERSAIGKWVDTLRLYCNDYYEWYIY